MRAELTMRNGRMERVPHLTPTKRAIIPEVIAWSLWRILHAWVTVVWFARDVFSRLGRYVCSASGDRKGQLYEIAGAKRDKLLTIAVVFESQEAMELGRKIPQLIFWLSVANVGHVTLYDPAGTLKRSQVQLQSTLNSLETKDQKIHCYSGKLAELLSELNDSQNPREGQSTNCQATNIDFLTKAKLEEPLPSDLCSLRRRISEFPDADFVSDRPLVETAQVCHMKVELLSLEDGKESLVRAARNVCEIAYKIHGADNHYSRLPNLTEEEINESLQATGCQGPDPDLLLLFSTTRSLLGFPPWRLRLTEIVHMGSLKDLTASSFVAALRQFATKTHRYGR